MEERKRYIIGFKDIPQKAQKVPEITLEERSGNFKEVELGFTEEMAIQEAKRCLSCRRCLGCGLCLAECEKEAVLFEQIDEEAELLVDSVIATPPSVTIPLPIKEEYGYDGYSNVVLDIEFERILSETGPYGGLIIRPYDGELPKKIGFIWDGDHKSGYSSLLRLMKEAIGAKKKAKDLETSIFISLGGDSLDLDRLLAKFPEAPIKKTERVKVKEMENRNLLIESDGKEEEFEMVVVSTQPKISENIACLIKKLKIDAPDYIFHETGKASLTETSKAGVFFAGGSLKEKNK
jgi:heterodisulfide reductase subunit A-like polyferredoxin